MKPKTFPLLVVFFSAMLFLLLIVGSRNVLCWADELLGRGRYPDWMRTRRATCECWPDECVVPGCTVPNEGESCH
jgi:hypothetical protein